jgi:hypothetical protein
MGYSAKPDLVTVTLTSNTDYFVKVDTEFTYGEVKTVDPESKGYAISDKLLLMSIKEWNIDDDAGVILPITQENIDFLKQEDITAIMNEINKEAGDNSEKKGS